MFFHVAFVKWKEGVTEEQVVDVLEKIRDVATRVPSLQGIHWGPNTSPRAQGYTHAIVIIGTSAAALDDYRADELRKEASATFLELALDIVAADFHDWPMQPGTAY